METCLTPTLKVMGLWKTVMKGYSRDVMIFFRNVGMHMFVADEQVYFRDVMQVTRLIVCPCHYPLV